MTAPITLTNEYQENPMTTTKKRNRTRPDIFQAVWPIITQAGRGPVLTDAELIEDAIEDLPNIAARHNVRISGKPRGAAIMNGALVPGFRDTPRVVVIEAPYRPNGWTENP